MVTKKTDNGKDETHIQAGADRPDARPARNGRTAAEPGATPSNTAPDNSIPFMLPLRWGVDSLYLSYHGKLSEQHETELRTLKQTAQQRDYEAALAQYRLGDHIFEVKDKGSGLFPFALEDNAFHIKLSGPRAKSLPMAYVKLSSQYLSSTNPQAAELHLRELLRPLGDLVGAPTVSRIDLYVDFVSSVSMESWDRTAWVTRASSITQFSQDQKFSGWSIGLGSSISCRLYNKTLELAKSKKFYLLDLWSQAGWDSDTQVWRLEFELKREILAQLGLGSLPSVLGNRNGLWNYAMTEWLKLTQPNPNDSTRSRWPVHPLWVALSSIDWETSGGPLLRSFSPTREPSFEYLANQALGLATAYGAVQNLADFDRAWEGLGGLAFDALHGHADRQGIPWWQCFDERVQIRARKFNTLYNLDQISDEDRKRLELDQAMDAYRNASKGR